MGLLNKRNIAKAKALAEKNKEKIASGVNKATDAIDKKTGGKHTDKLKKVDDAAKKFAGEAPRSDTGSAASDSTTSTPGVAASDSTTSTPGAAASDSTTSTPAPPAADTDTTTR